MKDLRIYDFEFNLLAVENKIISSDWQFYFNDIGKAEIHLSKNGKSIPVIFDNKYLFITQGEKQAIVTAKQIGNECVIYGRTPDWLLSRRVIGKQSTLSGNAETLIRDLAVKQAFKSETFFSLGEMAGITKEIEIPVKESAVFSDIVTTALSKCKAGRRMYLDIKNKKWVFELLKGKEISLVLSESALNAYDTEYAFDLQNYYTHGAFANSEQGGNTYFVYSSKKTGIYRWETPLKSTTVSDAQAELSPHKIEEELNLKVKNLSYGKDYNLGDVVTVSIDTQSLKRTKKYRIIGLEIWEEHGDAGERPIFEITEG